MNWSLDYTWSRMSMQEIYSPYSWIRPGLDTCLKQKKKKKKETSGHMTQHMMALGYQVA